MAEDRKLGGGLPVDIDISIEAGDWPDEAGLTRL
ncbi:MAG: rRNA maturation RNase YbeY, partial [Mesorhizobium sp.]